MRREGSVTALVVMGQSNSTQPELTESVLVMKLELVFSLLPLFLGQSLFPCPRQSHLSLQIAIGHSKNQFLPKRIVNELIINSNHFFGSFLIPFSRKFIAMGIPAYHIARSKIVATSIDLLFQFVKRFLFGNAPTTIGIENHPDQRKDFDQHPVLFLGQIDFHSNR